MTGSYARRLTKSSNAFLDVLQRWRRPVYSGHPKVLTCIISKLKIQSGDTVLECGAGNGVGTALFARTVGASGRVYSIDIMSKSIEAVNSHLNKWQGICRKQHGVNLPNNVTLVNSAIEDIDAVDIALPSKFDLIFIDIGEPASKLQALSNKLLPGRCLAVYIPSVTRIVELLEVIKLQALPLVLEGVWEESLNVITMKPLQFTTTQNDCTETLKKYQYGLKTSYRDESTTAFLVKFCKVVPDDNADGLQETFQFADHVMLSSMHQRKKGRQRSVVVQLESGRKFYNDWGSIRLDDITSLSPGNIIETSSGQSLYVTLPSFPEFILRNQMNKTAQGVAMFLPRYHHLLSVGANVCHGTSVMEISAVGTSLTQHLSETVGEEGHVYSIIEDRHLITTLSDAWSQAHNNSRSKELINNSSDLGIPDLSNLSRSGTAVDAVILMPRSMEDVDSYISNGLKLLKAGNLMSILCKSLEQVFRTLQHNAVATGELFPKIIYEDKDRPWIIRQPRLHPKTCKSDEDSLSYICRPKHGESCPTGYIVVLIKSLCTK